MVEERIDYCCFFLLLQMIGYKILYCSVWIDQKALEYRKRHANSRSVICGFKARF